MVSSIARPANIVYVKALKRKLLVGSMRHDICRFNSRWGSMLRNSGPLRPAAQDWASRPFRLNAEKGPCLPPLPLTRSGNEEEDDGPGGSALEHNYQPTLDRAYCEGIPPRTGPQGQGGLRPADPYQAWAFGRPLRGSLVWRRESDFPCPWVPVRGGSSRYVLSPSPRYLHVILTVLKSLSNTL